MNIDKTKELERVEKALKKEKNLNQISFYEGYIKGLKFEGKTGGDIDKTIKSALEEFDEKWHTSENNGGWNEPYEGPDFYLAKNFLKEKLKEAYEEGKEELIKEIKDWAEKYMEATKKYYGTDKNGISPEDLLNKLNKIK